MIIISLGETSYSRLLKKAREAQAKGDLIEIRLDYQPEISTKQIRELNQTFSPLFTVRSKSEGGEPYLYSSTRHDLLRKVMVQKPKYLDLEYKRDLKLLKELEIVSPKTKVILSYHELKKMPKSVKKMAADMEKFKTWKIKIVGFAKTTMESLQMLESVQKHSNLIGIAMGERGFFTRILGPLFGQPLTYASLDEKKTASGQLSATDLEAIFHYSKLNTKTKLLGILGNPLKQSPGFRVHNRIFVHEKINAVYVNFELEKNKLQEGIKLLKTLGLYGASVTIPFKEEALKYLDSIVPEQKDIQSINTLKISQKKLRAKNTDGVGALRLFEQHGPVKGKKVVLIGAGGTAHGIGYVLKKSGAELLIFNRTYSKAKALAKELDAAALPIEQLSYLKKDDYDILVQTTSVGAFNKQESIVPAKVVYPKKLLLDVVFNESRLLKTAQQKGCIAYNGKEFWIFQAKEQLKFWFGNPESDLSKLMKEYMP